MMSVEGLLNNTALASVPLKIDDYITQIIVADFTATLAVYQANVESAEPEINQETADAFASSMDNNTPYISNATGEEIDTDYYTTILEQHAENLFPILDLAAAPTNNQIFAQYAMIAMGQKETANKYINSALNATSDLCAGTFTSQDALMTGSLSSINSRVNAWGEELYDSGSLFDFEKLDNLGTPQAIIESLMLVGMLGFISDELTLKGIDIVPLVKAIQDNPTQVLSPIVQKRCYEAFALVTGDKLRNILKSMHFVTPGLTTLQELLDLTKVFPATYKTLTAPSNSVLQNIYNSNGSIATWVANLSSPIIAVIPDEQAKANWAFIISLGQVRGILNSTPGQIGSAASTVQTNRGLLKTGSLTETLPDSTADYILDSMGEGSGPRGTYYLSDLIGASAGLPFNENIDVMVRNFQALDAVSGFSSIALVFETMRGVLSGRFQEYDDEASYYDIVIPDNLPGTGTYGNETQALNALLAEQDVIVAEYIARYPTEHGELFGAFTSSLAGVVGGIKQLWDAEVQFNTTYVTGYETRETVIEPGASVNPSVNGIPANKKSTMAFAENLGQYGKKTDKGNIASILEAMVTDTLGGDAIVAAMREGRNQEELDASGIRGDNQISDQPSTVEPGNIS